MKLFIASILTWNGTTGVQTHVREIFPFLKKGNLKPHFICPHDGNLFEKLILTFFVLVRYLIKKIFPTKEVELYRFGHSFILKLRLQKKLSSGEACAIYAQCPVSAQAALRARIGSHQKVILVVHFNISQADEFVGQGRITSDSSIFKSIRTFEDNLFPKLDGLVFVSAFMHENISKRIPDIFSIPYEIIPNFLSDPIKKLDIISNDYDLVCIGTLEARKNQSYALEIIAAANELGRSISLTLIGDGPDRNSLENLSDELKIRSNINFLGFINQAANYLEKHRACLHVAHVENLPITLIESLSRGVPIFAPAVGGIPEIFSDGIEGRIIPLNNPIIAAQLILEWLDKSSTLEQASISARTRFKLKFCGDIVGPKLVKFLYSVSKEVV